MPPSGESALEVLKAAGVTFSQASETIKANLATFAQQAAGKGRPRVRIPVSEVPWISGTIADLECARRRRGTDYGEYHPNCCRWPKSCSAFDPGFTTGKGPTTLPVVYNDGYGWRSQPAGDGEAAR